MDHKEAGEIWAALHAEWQKANDAAREAELKVLKGFRDFAANTGRQPSDDELERAAELRKIADGRQHEMETFMRGHFGS